MLTYISPLHSEQDLLGPASILAWIIAGLMAITIALCFAECSSIIPRVGGPYAYAKEAFGDLWDS